jgi:hypothetical protein
MCVSLINTQIREANSTLDPTTDTKQGCGWPLLAMLWSGSGVFAAVSPSTHLGRSCFLSRLLLFEEKKSVVVFSSLLSFILLLLLPLYREGR